VRAEQLLAIFTFVIADDDSFAAAEWHTCGCALVGHPSRQSQGVDDSFFFGRVVPETRASNRRTEPGAVYSNDAAIPRNFIVTEHNLLVAHRG
jgi:hypothetical protein